MGRLLLFLNKPGLKASHLAQVLNKEFLRDLWGLCTPSPQFPLPASHGPGPEPHSPSQGVASSRKPRCP